jgi:hypothetical protein
VARGAIVFAAWWAALTALWLFALGAPTRTDLVAGILAARRGLDPVNAYLWAATVLLLGLVPLLAVCMRLRGHPLPRLAVRPLDRLRALHTGVVGDYVAWLVFGTAVLGGFVTLAVR